MLWIFNIFGGEQAVQLEKFENSSPLFQCTECGLHYKEREWKEKCEAWCRVYHSCNLEITAHAKKQETIIKMKALWNSLQP
jgi:hypothetical protein